MPDVRSNCENESSEDGSSSLEPQPSTPPVDKMRIEKEVHLHQRGRGGHRYSSFADAVTNGHAGTVSNVITAYENRDGASMDHDTEFSNTSTISDQQLSHLPPRAPLLFEEATQPLSSDKTSQMSMTTYDVDSRATTPSGIMREMSLKEKEGQDNVRYNVSNIKRAEESRDAGGIIDPTSDQHLTISSEETDKTAAETLTTSDQVDTSGLGALLSKYNSQQPRQQRRQQRELGSDHVTTYYSMASQSSLPIHTPTAVAPDNERMRKLSKEFLRSPENTFQRLSFILGRGRLVMINFSQRNLGYRDAELLREAILANPQLGVLKLSYNNLGNIGTNLIATAINFDNRRRKTNESALNSAALYNSGNARGNETSHVQNQQHNHHPSLTVLDLGFNNVGDEGCLSLASLAVAHNPVLSTLYLSGNDIKEQGSVAMADAIAGGCGLTTLHLTANQIGPQGVKGLMRSMAEFDVTLQMALQDRENRMALEEEAAKRERQSSVDGDILCPIRSSGESANGDVDDMGRLNRLKCMEELYLGGTKMESTGCLSVSNMLLTNLSLRVLCLSDNGLNDHDLSLFSQSISRNKQLPLEVLRLSFNKLTCVGVETLMNAIWGSKTLREVKLDNNQIRDRGAQLAAVVLTSVDLEVLDIGFNRLTIVGIKALMKSLAENSSLLSLTLSGNVLDTNASKAVSYALAYNRTIRKLYLDHCSLSYAAQRHIAAGIVSNSYLALRVMSGFPLGAISVTLGLPGALEHWTNEQVLKFIRLMWDRKRCEAAGRTNSFSSVGASVSSVGTGADKPTQSDTKIGPSDPATVVAAAKEAFASLGDDGGALLLTEEPQRAISDTSPMVCSDAVMLEKTLSGSVIVPCLDEFDDEAEVSETTTPNTPLHMPIKTASAEQLCTSNGKDCPESPIDPVAKKRNMDWLRQHYRSLNEIIQLPYVYADLTQLHKYFFSLDSDDDNSGTIEEKSPQCGIVIGPGVTPFTSPTAVSGPQIKQALRLQRKPSFRGLHDIAESQHSHLQQPQIYVGAENSSKRRPVPGTQPMQPASKRARNGKPRIDYFPRIKAKVEEYLATSKQTKALILLRQLKYVETTLFSGSNPYCDLPVPIGCTEPLVADAEIILMDIM